jgi:hypothetical protein
VTALAPLAVEDRDVDSAEATRLIRAALEIRGAATIRVTGHCMAPAFPEGSVASLRPADAAPFGFGDVVLLQTPLGLRLHRIVARRRGAVRTMGDRGTSLDPLHPINPTEVLAVATNHESRWRARARAVVSIGRLIAERMRV